MKKSYRIVGKVLVASTLSAVVTTSVFALGFRNPDQGVRATGQGEAFVAQADDASAIWYNPAGLTQIDGTEDSSSVYLNFSHATMKGPAYSAENNAVSMIPNFYISTDFGKPESPLRYGLGLNIPYGDAVRWGRTTPMKYLATRSDLTVFNIAPAVAYKVNEHLSLGAVLNIYHGNTLLERDINFAPVPVPDGKFRFEGDGDAVSGTLGAMVKINEQHSFGVIYRAPFAIEFKGDARVTDPVPAASSGPSPARSTLQFPQSLAVGYAFRPIPRLKLEVDVEWTDWNTLNTVRLHSPNPLFDSKTNPAQTTIPFNWQDSFCYEVGAQFDINEHWVARTGYIFSENTVPDSSFSPTLPDSDRHVFSVGLGYIGRRMKVDVVYQLSYAPERTVSGSPFGLADGKWQTSGHAVMIGSTFKF